MWNLIAVACGGAIGASLRYGAEIGLLRLAGPSFPYNTLFVNVVGSLIMGFLGYYLTAKSGSEALRLFLLTGLLGGFTTFSAFSLDSVALWQEGRAEMAGLYIGLSFVLSIAFLVIGLKIAKAML